MTRLMWAWQQCERLLDERPTLAVLTIYALLLALVFGIAEVFG